MMEYTNSDIIKCMTSNCYRMASLQNARHCPVKFNYLKSGILTAVPIPDSIDILTESNHMNTAYPVISMATVFKETIKSLFLS